MGDWCFGYQPVPIPGSEVGRGRNAEPRMQYRIDPETAPWVVRIFEWFVKERRSIRWITKELTRQNAPKDHRSWTPGWHHDYVRRVLSNRKYVGVWDWGERTNNRNPLTGQVKQEERPVAESMKWTRQRPDLRIIDDATFEAAQAILKANEAKVGSRRRDDGKLSGSARSADRNQPRHLLSGLMRCTCGRAMVIGGADGKYLFCPNYPKGLCPCQTHLQRLRAEKLILQAISQRIRATAVWKSAVLTEASAAWNTLQTTVPNELKETQRALAEVNRKIERLLDLAESDNPPPQLNQRLARRLAERGQLERREADQRSALQSAPSEPTEEWVTAELRHLEDLLAAGGPAAAHALRTLVGGTIELEESREPGKQRFYLRGRFRISTTTLHQSMAETRNPAQPPVIAASEGSNVVSEEIIIDFREANDNADVERAKELIDKGLKRTQIAALLGCARNWVTVLLRRWFEARGLPVPDGRKDRATCATNESNPPRYKLLAEAAKQLWDQGLADVQIAERLGCSPPTMDAAIDAWHKERGLPTPTHADRRSALVDRMQQCYAEGALIKTIAQEVGMCSRSVTLLLRERFAALGLPRPDGRTRRALKEKKEGDEKPASPGEGLPPAAGT